MQRDNDAGDVVRDGPCPAVVADAATPTTTHRLPSERRAARRSSRSDARVARRTRRGSRNAGGSCLTLVASTSYARHAVIGDHLHADSTAMQCPVTYPVTYANFGHEERLCGGALVTRRVTV